MSGGNFLYRVSQPKKWTRHLCTFMFNFLLLFQFHIIRFSCLDVFPVSKCENLSSKHPIFLRPWEHYAFLFRIIHHESQLGSHKVWICQIWVVTCHQYCTNYVHVSFSYNASMCFIRWPAKRKTMINNRFTDCWYSGTSIL